MAVATLRSSAAGKTGTVTVTHTASPPPAGSALATAAQSLGTNQSAAFPIPTYAALPNITGRYYDWAARWMWDSVRNRGWWMTKTAESAGSPPYKLFRYEGSTDTWTKPFDERAALGGGTGTGHCNDGGALDEATGDFYFLPLYAENVVKWNGSGWTVATGNVTAYSPTQANDSYPNALCWHPNLYGAGDGGLVTSFYYKLNAWRKSSGSAAHFVQLPATPTNPDLPSRQSYNQAVYCPAFDGVIMTAGTSSQACHLITPGPTVTRIQDTPVVVSVAANVTSNMSRLFATPTGTAAIFEYGGQRRVWQYVHSAQQWALQDGLTHPLSLPGSAEGAWPTAFISDLGIYWALRMVNGGNSPPDSLIWRPPGVL